jgi:formamidopyrimidine-DNA glycosylase
MPELPEVETMARDLDALLRGATIRDAVVAHPKLLVAIDPPGLARWIEGMTIAGVRRRAKSLIIAEARGERRLIFAPRMTGEPRVVAAGAPVARHEHLRFPLDDGRELRFADPRRFGRLTAAREGVGGLCDLDGRDPFARIGPEPLEPGWSDERLREQLARRPRVRIKALLLDQRSLAGVGNIYADEALWRARIHPERPAGSLTARESGALHRAIREILATAVERRGSRVATYRSPGGGASMQEALSVYGCGGEPCRRCRTSIRKYTLAGRGTHHCPVCQALP